MKRVVFLAWVIVICVSCQKEYELGGPATKFELTSPVPFQSASRGDTVDIVCTVTGQGVLHGYRIIVSDVWSHKVYYELKKDTLSQIYKINEKWWKDLPNTGGLKLDIAVRINEQGEEEVKSIAIGPGWKD